MHIGSFLASALLHAMLVLLVVLWPSSKPPLDLSQAVKISIVEGAPGGEMLASAVLGKTGETTGTAQTERAKPEAQPIAPPPPEAAPIPAQPIPEAKPVDVPPEPPKSAAEAPRPESIPAPIPAPPKEPEVAPVAEKKNVEPKPDPKPTPKPDPKPDPKPEPPKKAATPKKTAEVSREEAMKAALRDMAKQAKPEPKNTGQAARDAARAAALKDLGRQAKQGTGGGGGGEGAGPGGGGLYDVFIGSVMKAVQANWQFTAPQDLMVVVRLKLDKAGNLVDCEVVKSSGNIAYDASALNAVRRTKTFPPPPTREQEEIDIRFSLRDMIRR